MNLKIDGNNIYIMGNIYNGDGRYFLSRFLEVSSRYSEVNIFLHSLGGSVFAGNLIYNTLVSSDVTINMRVIGVAASMGFVIMLAGDTIEMVENGFCMSHEASGYTEGGVQAHKSSAKLLEGINQSFIRKLMMKTGKEEKELKPYLEGDNWFTAEQALDEGFIDRIVDANGNVEIEDPTALTHKEINARFSASIVNQNYNIVMNYKSLIARMRLDISENASETEIAQAVDAKLEAIKTERDNAVAELQRFKDAQAESTKAKITNLVNAAKNKGLIAQDEINVYQSIGEKAGVEALEASLGKITPRQSITDAISQSTRTNTPSARQGWDWDKYQEEDPRALEAMKGTEEFKALYKAKFGVDFNS